MLIAIVIVHLPIRKYFQYRVPNFMIPVIGGRVVVPFRSKELIGIVLSLYTDVNIDKTKYKFIKSIIDKKSLYTNILLSVLVWSSKYYHCPIGDVFFSILPKFLRLGNVLPKMYIKKWTLTDKGVSININNFKKNAKIINALLFLKKKSLFSYELKKYNISFFILQALIKEKLCKETLLSTTLLKKKSFFFTKKNMIVNYHILFEIENIFKKTNFSHWLLTKTTLYIKVKFYFSLIKKILEKESQILIIVPYTKNINRITSLLKQYFNVSISIIHSQLTDIQYLQNWFSIQDGRKKIVIGTQKSVFMPFFKLGLIIVLEENSYNYSNIHKFRYNARDISILVGFKSKIPVILDSNIPSLKTLHNVITKKCALINLFSNYHCNKIQHQIINLKHAKIKCGLSQSLIDEMQQIIKNKQQVLLIFNKLNFVFLGLICRNCGWIEKCYICNDYFEIDLLQKMIICKYCIIKIPMPIFCRHCKIFPLAKFSFSKKYITSIIKRIFPKIPVIFLTKKNALKKNYEFFLQIPHSKPYIIIALDEIIKNYFFPHVKLIGLLSIDHYFYCTNFRFLEYFSQFYMSLNQIVRDSLLPVKAVIQTSFSYHQGLVNFFDSRYSTFVNQILRIRKRFLLPPWSCQIIIYAQSFSSENSFNFLSLLYTILKKQSQKDGFFLWLVGPNPNFSLKYKKCFIYCLLVQHSSQIYLQKLLKKSLYLINYFSISRKVKWFIKINIE